MWKTKLILFLWILLGAGMIVLLVAAGKIKANKQISDVKIEIEGVENHVFVDEKEVLLFLQKKGVIKDAETARINTRILEAELGKNVWIKDVNLFFDNNATLYVKIKEREPVARIFTVNGASFYIDSSMRRLPLSDDESASVPVFTSFSSDNEKLSAPDSSLLHDVKNIALFIQQDSFWMAQVSQVDITPQRTFEMIPVLGNQVIELGNADSLQQKFDRLFSFYKQVWAHAGFEKYEKIDVQYSGQVVATKRGAAKALVDSVQAMQRLTNTMQHMDKILRDTTVASPADKNFVSATSDTTVIKKENKKVQQPKAVMSKQHKKR